MFPLTYPGFVVADKGHSFQKASNEKNPGSISHLPVRGEVKLSSRAGDPCTAILLDHYVLCTCLLALEGIPRILLIFRSVYKLPLS